MPEQGYRQAPELVAATSNPGKLQELAALLADFTLISQEQLEIEPAEETGLSFVENALLKARHAARHAGLPALADDSGLEVDALDGAPGIYSARFAGQQADDQANCHRLLQELAGVTQRRARFRCVLVCLRHDRDPAPLICQGTWEGNIAAQATGEGGFGYDPLFIPAGLEVTAAQLDAAEKNRRSHRGQALLQLRAQLPDFLSGP